MRHILSFFTGRIATLTAIITMTLAISSSAQELEDSIPIDLARALLATWDAEDVQFYSGVPEGLPDFEVPENLEVLGGVYQPHAQQLVLRTEAASALGQQRREVLAALEKQGFIVMTQPPTASRRQRGFVAPSVIPENMPIQMCHDRLGRLIIRAIRAENVGFVTLMTQGGGRPAQPQSCGESRAMQMQRGSLARSGRSLNEYLPRLELPPEVSRSRSRELRTGGGTDSSAGMIETRTELNTELSLAEVYEHFAGQMNSQGWTLDSQSKGEVSATGNWTKGADDDQLLLSTLHAVRSGEDGFQLRLSVAEI